MADNQKFHVVMFPWLAHGHITPLLQLANSLLSYGIRISFISTPLNIAWIYQQILQSVLPPGIELVELPFPSVHGLPVGIESTKGLSEIGRTDLNPLLLQALDLCEQPFEELLNKISPNFVIHDVLVCWIPRAAAKLGIPTISFMFGNAATLSFVVGHHMHGLPKNPRAEDLIAPPPGFPSQAIRQRLFEARYKLPSFQNRKDGLNFMDRSSVSVEGSWATACNTCFELEDKFVDYFQRSTGKFMFPVGILTYSMPLRPAGDPCLAWLDKQPARSVVFASFGSECVLPDQQLHDLLLGLEECKIPFLCVVLGQAASELVQGFEDRSHGTGLVVTEWVPQLHILNHPSTGAFLTHCGWGSLTEGLRFGVPFIALPVQYDQGFNARLVVDELKVGVEVRRNEEDGSFTKEDIVRAVRAVLVDEEGCRVKSNLGEISRVLNHNDSQVYRRNIYNFVSALKEKVSTKQSV